VIGKNRHTFESFIKKQLIYGREKSEIIEELIFLEYKNHEDPNDKVAVRQLMMDSASHSDFVAPALLEANALAKVRIQVTPSQKIACCSLKTHHFHRIFYFPCMTYVSSRLS